MEEHLTVGRLAALAGVTVRTLHHYDEIGLLRPSARTPAGHRAYAATDGEVTAVEPSAVMRAQRPAGAAPCVAAAAANLPFPDASFDAAMAVSTIHHWPDALAGLREMQRVARRVVVFTFDADEPGWLDRFWLTRDYLPEFAGLLTGAPSLAGLTRAIGGRTEPVEIPWDCADGFFEAHWRRPEAYLQEPVRRAVSVWTRVGAQAEQRAVNALRADLSRLSVAEPRTELCRASSLPAACPLTGIVG